MPMAHPMYNSQKPKLEIVLGYDDGASGKNLIIYCSNLNWSTAVCHLSSLYIYSRTETKEMVRWRTRNRRTVSVISEVVHLTFGFGVWMH